MKEDLQSIEKMFSEMLWLQMLYKGYANTV